VVRAAGVPAPLPERVVRRAVEATLGRRGSAGRRVGSLAVTFLTRPAIRRLNREWLGHDWATDVVSFPLAGPDGLVAGDIYICPAVAREEARTRGIAVREELIRLVVHGTLHVLGHEHPEGPDRVHSAMWRRQERLVRSLA
jgi:probable rRNA maturation factor